jgi:hypothetical protein
MTLCPIAIAVGCRKCPAFAICPVKGVIGDYKKEKSPPEVPASGAASARTRASKASGKARK